MCVRDIRFSGRFDVCLLRNIPPGDPWVLSPLVTSNILLSFTAYKDHNTCSDRYAARLGGLAIDCSAV